MKTINKKITVITVVLALSFIAMLAAIVLADGVPAPVPPEPPELTVAAVPAAQVPAGQVNVEPTTPVESAPTQPILPPTTEQGPLAPASIGSASPNQAQTQAPPDNSINLSDTEGSPIAKLLTEDGKIEKVQVKVGDSIVEVPLVPEDGDEIRVLDQKGEPVESGRVPSRVNEFTVGNFTFYIGSGTVGIYNVDTGLDIQISISPNLTDRPSDPILRGDLNIINLNLPPRPQGYTITIVINGFVYTYWVNSEDPTDIVIVSTP